MKKSMNVENDFKIQALFPVPVGVFNFEKSFSKKEISFISNLKTHNNQGNTVSDESYVLTDTDDLIRIRKFVLNSAKLFFKEIYQPNDDLELYITQSWCNYTKKGEYHHSHAHPNSFISGVLYIDGNEDSDKIYFNKDVKYRQIKVFPNTYNPFNADSWWLPATPGTLYIFDSSLEHRVVTVEGEKTRISLSFNTFLKGTIGSAETLTELKTHKLG